MNGFGYFILNYFVQKDLNGVIKKLISFFANAYGKISCYVSSQDCPLS